MKKYSKYLIIFLFPSLIFCQEIISGKILFSSDNKDYPIEGANIYWLNSSSGTVTGQDGKFSIEKMQNNSELVISYIGFVNDTIRVTDQKYLDHYMKVDDNDLDEVTVFKKKNPTQRIYSMAQNVVLISEQELLKAACCNLSESFETNPAVDVNHTDALTGSKKIEMLGLKSPYILITEENIPMVRGASQAFGLSFTPGTWVESIQVTKGMGSVVNGFESIAGQINAELKKPLNDIPLFLNGFYGFDGRLEMNAHLNEKISEKLTTTFFLHHNRRDKINDKNNDGFLDKPLQDQNNFLNKWQYTDAVNGIVSFFNIRYLDDEKIFGMNNNESRNVWNGEISTKRFDSSFKLGYVNPNLPFQSLGLQLSYSSHDQNSVYGFRNYDINQDSFFSNIVYNSIITNTQNKIKFGLNFTSDAYEEILNRRDITRKDNSFGGFFEYSFDNFNNLNLVAGLRYDTHNNMGSFFTPRFHMRYTPLDRFTVNASYGQGRKIANIFAENQQMFYSNRSIEIIESEPGNLTYGLNPETATNYGLSLDKGFNLFGGQGNFIIDYFKTDFDNKVIIDFEYPGIVQIYNATDKKSYYQSFQAEIIYSLNRFNMTTAYKNYDVQISYNDGIKSKPLQPSEIFFLNIGYESQNNDGKLWKYDFTLNRVGKQRLMRNPRDISSYTNPHTFINAQVTKVFSEKFELYAGGENLLNYKQENPIIFSEDPSNSLFDASIIHGPIFGMSFYAGFRFKVLN
ncbi:TonB-dependent receptor [Flavobacteriales bacterium]|nr:TonB-dependent receptor [Flavobacteriales bacterium]